MWPNPQETVDLLTFTEKILYGKLFFHKNSSRLKTVSYFRKKLCHNCFTGLQVDGNSYFSVYKKDLTTYTCCYNLIILKIKGTILALWQIFFLKFYNPFKLSVFDSLFQNNMEKCV